MTHIKIQSISDIITNSSSECFIVEDDRTAKEIKQLIESWNIPYDDSQEEKGDSECYSGMGGEVSVYDNNKQADDFYKWLPDGYFAVDVDWSRKKTIKRIFEDLKVVDAEDMDLLVDKSTCKIIRAKEYKEEVDKTKYDILRSGHGIIFESMIKQYEKELEDIRNQLANSLGLPKKKIENLLKLEKQTESLINELKKKLNK